jgi:cytidine deaminase
MMEKDLVEIAKKARENAYAPYSKFKVGAAILTEDGRIFTGVNVENASYGLSICAERVAVFKAVSEGYRKFKAIAVVADTDNPTPPCGACRQVLAEFGNIDVIMANLKGDVKIMKLSELLPEAFTPEDLRR